MKEHPGLEALKREPSKADVLEDLVSDPIRGPLFGVFVRALGPERRDPNTGAVVYPGKQKVTDMLKARTHPDRKGLRSQEQVLLQNLVVEFTRREEAGKRFLANLGEDDQKELASLVTRQVTAVNEKEFPLWVMGIAVRGEVDMDSLAEASRQWKKAVRDTVTENRMQQDKETLDRLAKRYGVTEAEINRFIQIEDDDERLRELQAAVANVSWFKKAVHVALQPHIGTRTGALNKLIKDFRREYSDLETGVNGIVSILSSIKTKRDPWYKDLPEMMQKEAAQSAEKVEDRPLDLVGLQEQSSEAAIIARYEKFLKEKGRKGAFEAYQNFKKQHVGNPAALHAETIPWGAGRGPAGRETIGNTFDTFASLDRSNVEGRLVNNFLEALFALFGVTSWNNAKDALAQ